MIYSWYKIGLTLLMDHKKTLPKIDSKISMKFRVRLLPSMHHLMDGMTDGSFSNTHLSKSVKLNRLVAPRLVLGKMAVLFR